MTHVMMGCRGSSSRPAHSLREAHALLSPAQARARLYEVITALLVL